MELLATHFLSHVLLLVNKTSGGVCSFNFVLNEGFASSALIRRAFCCCCCCLVCTVEDRGICVTEPRWDINLFELDDVMWPSSIRANVVSIKAESLLFFRAL